MHSAAIIAARPTWAEKLPERLHPGAHVILLTADEILAVEGRRFGFELRDTLLLLWPETTSFAFLFRKPQDEDTIADQMTTAGTGALNIGACRILGQQGTGHWSGDDGSDATSRPGFDGGFTRGGTRAQDGRWPPNVALVHGPHCRIVGERRIAGHKGYPNGPGGSSTQFSQKGVATTRQAAWKGYADADGKETIPLWACQTNCPAAILDQLSVDLPAGVAVTYGDKGGASKFYPQFGSPWEVLDWLRRLITLPGGDILEEV